MLVEGLPRALAFESAAACDATRISPSTFTEPAVRVIETALVATPASLARSATIDARALSS